MPQLPHTAHAQNAHGAAIFHAKYVRYNFLQTAPQSGAQATE